MWKTAKLMTTVSTVEPSRIVIYCAKLYLTKKITRLPTSIKHHVKNTIDIIIMATWTARWTALLAKRPFCFTVGIFPLIFE